MGYKCAMAMQVWCRNGHTPRAEMKLMVERNDCAVFRCPACKSVQVFTTPNENDRALWQKQRDEHDREVARRRMLEARLVYFT